MIMMIILSVEDRKSMLNGRLLQLARNHYDSTIDLEIAKTINDVEQIARIQSRLDQIVNSYNTVQSLLDSITA